MRGLLIGLVVGQAACVGFTAGQMPPPSGDDTTPDGGGTPTGDGPTGEIAGTITSDQTWAGNVVVGGATTINSGVTVTVAAGTTVTFANAGSLAIKGRFDVQGTKGGEVQLIPGAGVSFWGGFDVTGQLTMAYAIQRGGSIVVTTGGSVTIADTRMSNAGGDFLIMNGGSVSVIYSQIGVDAQAVDTTHCNMHFGGNGNTISVTHSNIEGAPYGLMFYGGQSAIFTDNNWDKRPGGAPDWIDSQPGVSANFSRGFFAGGIPVPKGGATFTVNSPSPTRLVDAGVR